MIRYHSVQKWCLLILSVGLLTGCAVSKSATPLVLSSPTGAFEPAEVTASSKTPTFEVADTPTPSLEPTLTSTPTITPSPTPSQVVPGFYASGGCRDTMLRNNSMKLTFCVLNVNVTRNRHMIFTVSWKLDSINSDAKVTKRSDSNNRNMYLIDNLGNRYDHISTGGAASKNVPITFGVAEIGSFEFGSSPPGAFSFDFHDDDNNLVIENITLRDVIILYEELALKNKELIMEYRKDLWTISELDGQETLIHKKIPGCTLEEWPISDPQGRLKNTAEIGNFTYNIYGYIDQEKNTGIREYILMRGLPGETPAADDFFFITIPLDASETCILDVSDLLARVIEK